MPVANPRAISPAARRTAALLASVALGLAGNAVADPIFHWVDDEGVAHYSDAAPGDVEDVKTLVLNPKNPPDYDPAADPYSIANQAERTSETWKELAARRDDRREKREAAAKREREARQAEYRPYPYSSRSWYYPPYYRPYWPPHVRPPVYPPRPAWPIKPTSEWTDPMRSAHIGVRRNPPPNSPK